MMVVHEDWRPINIHYAGSRGVTNFKERRNKNQSELSGHKSLIASGSMQFLISDYCGQL